MPSWTSEQNLAIEKENTNIIVSAGAGSGKTAVLTARVLRKLKSGVNINQLLILTFTNKAAFEMKDRIRRSITKDETLKNQLDYIDSSYISTFDSFALSMVKKYSYLLNIGSNVTIADSSTIYLEKEKIIDEIFNDLYKEKNEKFLNLINDFTIKKDDDIKNYILEINDKLDLKYDKNYYLDNYIDNYYSSKNIDMLIDTYMSLIKDKIREIDKLLNEISYHVDTDYMHELNESLSSLLFSNTYNDIKNSLVIKMPNLPRNSGEDASNIKDSIKKIIESLSELTRFNDIQELRDTFISTKSYTEVIIDIIKKLDFKINNFKKNLNIYEFTDISKMAIEILEKNEEERLELKNYFKEIMIDEYQDTSDLQEKFISLIENNNVYMVGDIKQSIYRFRNANPYIFKNKYDNYSNNLDGFKIDLTKNFRSRKEVINNINLLFSTLMTDNIGGADYIKSHKMLFGNTTYEEEGKTNASHDFEIYNYEYDKNLEFSKEEIEIFFIAKDIKDKVENKYQIFDKDEKVLKDARYEDFAILLDKSTNFDLYKKIFQYFNIPLTKYSATNITEEMEIVLIKNILKLLINRRDKNYDAEFKYAFTSIARSYLFEFDDQYIFDCVTNNKYDSPILDIIDSIVININNLSLKEILLEIINKFKFYEKCILVGDVKNRINRISSIIDIFDNLSNILYTIDDAYSYLDELISDQYKIEVKELDKEKNSVKIMTIHASKGLEFPICYFASLHSRFNIRDLNEKFLYNEKYGIITPYFKEGIGKTFVKELVKEEYLKEEISEKIRLLYVALTRAKEKFIIVTSIPDKSIYDISKARSFLDMYTYIKDIINPYINSLDINSLSLTRDYNLIKKTNYKESIKNTSSSFEVKEINIENENIEKERISKSAHELLDKDTKEKMKFGTKMHEILELIDFKNIEYDKLDIDNYYKEKIKKFISLIDIDKAINIYKEYEFLYTLDDKKYHGIIDLILEYDDSIKIIDYKLKDINDDNYLKQLTSYKNYIKEKSNKKIDIYLFSIIDGTLEKLS